MKMKKEVLAVFVVVLMVGTVFTGMVYGNVDDEEVKKYVGE